MFVNRGLHDWDRSHAQVPVANAVDENRIRIYYASRNARGQSLTSFIEVDAKQPSEILYEHNRPLLSLGSLGAFDESGIMPTCILDVKNEKFLYYIGWSLKKTVPYQNSVGLAISNDGGKSFKKFSAGPIVGVNNIDPYFTGTFFVLPDRGLFRAYYLSCIGWKVQDGRPEPLYVLKYAESSDGISWERLGKVVIDLEGDSEGGLVSAAVMKEDNSYRMWFGKRGKYDYRVNSDNSYRIGYAESDNGLEWMRKDSAAGIDISRTGWDSEMISYPNVVRVGEQLYMFYNGNKFGETGFGYAIWSQS